MAASVSGSVSVGEGPEHHPLHDVGGGDRRAAGLAVVGGERGDDRLGQLRLALHRGDGPAQHVVDALGGGVAPRRRGGDPALEVLHPLDHGGGEQRVLRREVAVDRAEGDLGRGGDVAHLHGVVAAVGAELRARPRARAGAGPPGSW